MVVSSLAIKIQGRTERGFYTIGQINSAQTYNYERYVENTYATADIFKNNNRYHVFVTLHPGIPLEEQSEPDFEEIEEIAYKIESKDFVVRRNTFHCLHKNHKHQQIDGFVDVMTKNGNIYSKTIPAAYCPKCNIYFIMETTYLKLRNCKYITTHINN